jgi:hypothetical protein
MINDDERDYAEERANLADMRREHEQEAAHEALTGRVERPARPLPRRLRDRPRLRRAPRRRGRHRQAPNVHRYELLARQQHTALLAATAAAGVEARRPGTTSSPPRSRRRRVRAHARRPRRNADARTALGARRRPRARRRARRPRRRRSASSRRPRAGRPRRDRGVPAPGDPVSVTGPTRELACLALGHDDTGEVRCPATDERLIRELVEEVQRLRVAAGIVEETVVDRAERSAPSTTRSRRLRPSWATGNLGASSSATSPTTGGSSSPTRRP